MKLIVSLRRRQKQNSYFDPFFFTMLCHTHIQRSTWHFCFFDETFSIGLCQGATWFSTATLRSQDSRLHTVAAVGCLYPRAVPSSHSLLLTESLLATRLRLTVTLWAPVYIWFHNANAFLVQSTCAGYIYASLSSCLHKCVLQSLCLHSWNIHLCQGSICNSTS